MCERRSDAEVAMVWNMAAHFPTFCERSVIMSCLNSLIRIEAKLLLTAAKKNPLQLTVLFQFRPVLKTAAHTSGCLRFFNVHTHEKISVNSVPGDPVLLGAGCTT